METPQPALHPNKEAFVEGVDHILNRWTALELAVQHEWGGHDSQEKREDMVDEIVEHFDKLIRKRKTPEPTDLEELLLDIMDGDFSVALDDQSEKEVAKLICSVFFECKTGNFTTVDRMAKERNVREKSGAAKSAARKSQSNNAQQMADDSGSEDDESASDSDVSMDV
ncbi:rRNA accumulation- protein [Coemansia sp. RSA 1365]|nr:rRNA accumulation- protein [Coemansia sp. RSA 1365]